MGKRQELGVIAFRLLRGPAFPPEIGVKCLGFPKIRDLFWGVPLIRIIVFLAPFFWKHLAAAVDWLETDLDKLVHVLSGWVGTLCNFGPLRFL